MKTKFSEFLNENQNTLPKEHKEIIKFVEDNSYFVYYGEEEDQLMFNTRENGSVGNEEASPIDIKEGKKLGKEIKDKFPNVDAYIEVVDEWVHLTIIEKVENKDEYRYIFKKDNNGAGFTQGFDTMDDLIDRFGDWVEVDWEQIKKDVDKIDKFPRNRFTGWHDSYPKLISKIGDKGNKWGYNFYIIKSKKDEDNNPFIEWL